MERKNWLDELMDVAGGLSLAGAKHKRAPKPKI